MLRGIDAFRNLMVAHGLQCPDPLVADEIIHRFHVEGDKPSSKNGWYIFHGNDGLPAGAFGSWKTGETFTWCGKERKTLTDAERAELRERIARAKAARDQELKKIYAEARAKAASIWKRSRPVKNHLYLESKNIKSQSTAIGLRSHKGSLVVPVLDVDEIIHGLQFISADGEKSFLTGSAITGHFYPIGDFGGGGTLLICEGYSTGASLHEATGYPVACALNCGNLRPVCEALRKKSPNAKLIVCADDDYQTEGGNPGVTKGREAAEATGAALVIPRFKDQAHRGTDFNDLHQIEGLEAVRLQIEDVLMAPADGDEKTPKKTQSQILCEIAENIETFCTPDGEVYAFIPVNEHLECWPVRWKIFKQWLVRNFFDQFDKPPGGQALSDALNVVEAKAQFSGAPKREVFLRVAEYNGKVYLDLCNEDWQVVEISADGWQVINVSPVPFKRPPGLLPLPEPRKGNKASFKALRKYVNLKSENDFILLVAWLVGALRAQGDHVILVLQGPEGTGKTTAARLIKGIVDPNVSSERSSPRNEEDFIIGASNNHVTSFDNISGIPPWLSDALCRLSTGGGLATRRLYTNDEEKLFYARRPALLTGINPMPTRNDLARRCIVLNLEPIRGQVLEEKALIKKFRNNDLPGILGTLCDAVSVALRNEQMEPKNLPCMASFTAWVLRAEKALPWKAGAFRSAYKENTQNIIEMAVDADLVSSAIQEFMTGRESWEGTASELLGELCEIVPEKNQRQKAWPQAPNVLSNKLKRASNFLRQVGIEVETGIRVEHERKRLIRLGRKKIVRIVTSSANGVNILKIQDKLADDNADDADDRSKKIVRRQLSENIDKNRQNDAADDADDEKPTLSKSRFKQQEVIDLW
ncbi:MAG: toprim domain-containing protein [Deltaproteobacteria bacterium]|nr:toprim domain-containing protein [Deltaproteobacteria bacterium]MBW2097895.1 toprim domain-containing protein [Deltaproteobacteria bacterium]